MKTSKDKIKVAYISTIIPEYKAWIVEALGDTIGKSFTAIHGAERAGTVPRDVGGRLRVTNNIVVRNRYLVLGGVELTWIPSIWWTLKNRPDVVILIDQVKILSNYSIHLWMNLTGRRVVYYGHGFNHQADLTNRGWFSRIVERIRLFTLKRASAIIVYDEQGKDHLIKKGVRRPIYSCNNTLDTGPILEFYSRHPGDKIKQEARSRLAIPTDAIVITFLGRLVAEKRVDFMIDVVKQLSARYGKRICGLIIGDGPERERLEHQSDGAPIIYSGYKSGNDLRVLLNMSDVVFLPGAVGLAIVEAFCAGKPFVTVRHDYHGPEISYLKDGENGILIPEFNVGMAVERLARLVEDNDFLARVSAMARRTAIRECNPNVMQLAFLKGIEWDGGRADLRARN